MDTFARFRRHRKDKASPATADPAPAPEPLAHTTADAPAPTTTTSTATTTEAPQIPPLELHTQPTIQAAMELQQSSSAATATGTTELDTGNSQLETRGNNGANPPLAAQPQQKPARTTSPSDVFRSRPGSSKRTRGPPPMVAPSPQSPTAPALPPMMAVNQPLQNPPKMPAFLNLSKKDIRDRYEELQWLERHRLQSSVLTPGGRWARVSGPHLRVLDRYINIQPWEKNRVRLQVPPGHIDYINASPVVLTTTAPAQVTRPPDRYIAMQGPKRSSVSHVWRMIYEQLRSPAVVVMLTETHEGALEKCYPYYPQNPGDAPILINEHNEFGDGFLASVRCDAIEETPYGAAIELRRCLLRVHRRATTASASVSATSATDDTTGGTGGAVAASAAGSAATGTELSVDLDHYEDERIVYHFLYRRWPDFGVPAVRDLESFFGLMRLSAEKNADENNPRIVHCSAGVGRSGTFIALEHLVRELDAGVLENYDAIYNASAAGRGEHERSSSGSTPDREHSSDRFAAIAAAGSDLASGHAPDEARDLIFTTVNQLREQRCTMVQSEPQYQFVYQVMRRLWQAKYGANLEDDAGHNGGGGGGGGGDIDSVDEDTLPDGSEPAAKRVEVDPFTDRP